MTTPVLWGRGSSTNVQKVIWTCAELGLSPERRIVGGPQGGTDAEAFGALNPNRTVPVWQEGQFVLWESQAIMRHLARVHGRLYGRTEAERAHVDCQLDWFAAVFFPPIRMLFLEVYTNKTCAMSDPRAQQALGLLHRGLDLADARIAGTDHFAGDSFSLADIAVAIGLNRALGLPYDITISQGLNRWLDRQASRPGFALATADEPDLPGTRKRQTA